MENIPLRFLNPWRAVVRSGGGLPHMEQVGACYFITFRLGDSLPGDLLEGWRTERERWRDKHPQPWDEATEDEYHRLFSVKIDNWLDAGHGACLLSLENCQQALFRKMTEGQGNDYLLHALVVMPNHVHVLVSIAGGRLAKIMQSWKGASARAINLETGNSGTVWQRDYFDRLVRDGRHFQRCVRYIRNNPAKAGLRNNGFLLWFREGV